MKISVLLPVYNAGPPLKRAVESILRQDFPDFELIVIDDASTDGSADIIHRYARMDSRIHPIFHSVNAGLPQTLNEGLRTAQCELVARMDQDDEALPHRLGIQYRFMVSRPSIAVAGSFFYYMGHDPKRDRLVKYPVSPDEVAETIGSYNCLNHPTVIMRRREILDLGGYRVDFKNAEDYDLWLRVVKHHEIANIPVALLRYRFSVSGMTLSRKWEQLYYVFLAIAYYEKQLDDASAYEEQARLKLSSIHKSDFLTHVANSTAEELFQLGFLMDAVKLLYIFSGDIGWNRALNIGWNLYRRRREFDSCQGNDWWRFETSASR
jgi:glycosyltransferase involved in cell wall biosynthesis